MLEGARDDIGAAPDHSLERARAAGEVGDGHLEPLGPEIAQAFGDRQRQVVEQVLAADRDREAGLLGFGGLRPPGGRQREQGRAGEGETAALHGDDFATS